MTTHKLKNLKWHKQPDGIYYLIDETRPFSNLGYVESIDGLFVAYIFEPLTKETYRELGFFDNAYDAKRAVEKNVPDFYKEVIK